MPYHWQQNASTRSWLGNSSDQVYPTLCEFFEPLRLIGLLLLTTPNPRYLKNKLGRMSVLGGAHISHHYVGNLRRRLMDIGISGIKIRGSGRVPPVLGERFRFAQSTAATLRKRQNGRPSR
jgi:hypothetical protein